MADAPEHAFSYHRAIAPMLWAFVALASIELVVVHLLLAHWSRTAALILSALSLATIVWLVGVIRGFRRLPVLLTPDALVMRVGALKGAAVPLGDVAGLRASWDAEWLRRRDVLNLALIAYPNVVVELRRPVPIGKRAVTAIAHRLDDPLAFAAALVRAVA
jgi:hypothetical protein